VGSSETKGVHREILKRFQTCPSDASIRISWKRSAAAIELSDL
jgi:hypothetical protein